VSALSKKVPGSGEKKKKRKNIKKHFPGTSALVSGIIQSPKPLAAHLRPVSCSVGKAEKKSGVFVLGLFVWGFFGWGSFFSLGVWGVNWGWLVFGWCFVCFFCCVLGGGGVLFLFFVVLWGVNVGLGVVFGPPLQSVSLRNPSALENRRLDLSEILEKKKKQSKHLEKTELNDLMLRRTAEYGFICRADRPGSHQLRLKSAAGPSEEGSKKKGPRFDASEEKRPNTRTPLRQQRGLILDVRPGCFPVPNETAGKGPGALGETKCFKDISPNSQPQQNMILANCSIQARSGPADLLLTVTTSVRVHMEEKYTKAAGP